MKYFIASSVAGENTGKQSLYPHLLIQYFIAISFFILFTPSAIAQQTPLKTEQVVYKQIDTLSLTLDIFYPPDMDTTQLHPGAVFFFGGGWIGGSIAQFKPHAAYFARRGLVCFLADYRVRSRQGTTPFEALKDAKSAIRFVRAHAARFHLNPDSIVALGGSAGGHLAAATALIAGFDEATDSLAVSPEPNALVLFNPVIDNGPAGYGYDRIDDSYREFSPLHNLKKGAPPTIIFLGTEDQLIPVETMEYYAKAMEKTGSRCDLHLYEGQGHGFFNYNKFEYYKKTIQAADQFLISLGYLQAEPAIPIE